MALTPTTPTDVTKLYSSGEFVAITPSDVTTYKDIRQIIVTVGGTLTMQNNSGDNIDFGTVAAGAQFAISPTMIRDTGTTATVLALY